jgi:TetR/AcrR family transcriptional repressor of nem operon
MPRDGSTTHQRILDAAEALILTHGFSASSIDRIILRAEVTKGTFFYHFESKAALALALVKRYAEADARMYAEQMTRAERLARDPKQQLLLFVGLLEEMFLSPQAPTGCLFASYCYEAHLFDDDTHEIIRQALLLWRRELRQKLERIALAHPPRIEVDLESLADGLNVVLEGAYVLSRTLKSPNLVAHQLRHFRNYLELVFA